MPSSDTTEDSGNAERGTRVSSRHDTEPDPYRDRAHLRGAPGALAAPCRWPRHQRAEPDSRISTRASRSSGSRFESRRPASASESAKRSFAALAPKSASSAQRSPEAGVRPARAYHRSVALFGRQKDEPVSIEGEQERLHAIRIAAEQELGRLRTELTERVAAVEARERELADAIGRVRRDSGRATRADDRGARARAGRARGACARADPPRPRARSARGRAHEDGVRPRASARQRRRDARGAPPAHRGAPGGSARGREGVRAHPGGARRPERGPRESRGIPRRAARSPARSTSAPQFRTAPRWTSSTNACAGSSARRERRRRTTASARASAPSSTAAYGAARPASDASTLSVARGVSSAGRAPALQAGGHRFDPDTLHGSTKPFAQDKSRARTRSEPSICQVLFRLPSPSRDTVCRRNMRSYRMPRDLEIGGRSRDQRAPITPRTVILMQNSRISRTPRPVCRSRSWASFL